MHNHTLVSSADSRLSAEDLIESARDRGLDGICVTEHSLIEGAEVAREVGERLHFPVFRGVEARSDLGDMLVFGYYRDVPDDTPFQELARRVLEAGGVIFAAHPFRHEGFTLQAGLRSHGLNLDDPQQCGKILELLDGIEVANGRSSPEMNGRAAHLAYRMGMPGIGGSDAHEPEDVGRAITRFSRPLRSEQDLVTALRHGWSKPFRVPAFSGEFLKSIHAPIIGRFSSSSNPSSPLTWARKIHRSGETR
ncbi:MAG: PHP domain-containing protein [Thermodesulfobacteriota bacterium]